MTQGQTLLVATLQSEPSKLGSIDQLRQLDLTNSFPFTIITPAETWPSWHPEISAPPEACSSLVTQSFPIRPWRPSCVRRLFCGMVP